MALTAIHAVVVALSKGESPEWGEGWSSRDFTDDLKKVYTWSPSARKKWFTLFAKKVADFSKGRLVFKFLSHSRAKQLTLTKMSGRGEYFSCTIQATNLTTYGYIGPRVDPITFFSQKS